MYLVLYSWYLLSCLLLYSLYSGVHQEQQCLLGVAPFSEQPKSRESVFGRSNALWQLLETKTMQPFGCLGFVRVFVKSASSQLVL